MISDLSRYRDYKLCYVDSGFAWFTSAPLDKQWGDDWNDAPYEHNAGTPYDWYEKSGLEPYHLIKVAFDGPLETPADLAGGNSRYSVEMINKGHVAWLCDRWGSSKVAIQAGCNPIEFVKLVQQAGGTVYVPVSV
jgi:hypothetical protein